LLNADQRLGHACFSLPLASPTGRGVIGHAEQPQATQQAFERVFEACRLQPACHGAFPHVDEDFYAVYERLNRSPLRMGDPSGNGRNGAVFDGHRLVYDIRSRMLDRPGISRLPLLLHELRNGDRLRAAREILGDGTVPRGAADAALREIVLCNDGDTTGPAHRRIATASNARFRPPFRRAADRENRECNEWIPRHGTPPVRRPVHSDIPTLLLTGYFDDRTPTDHARRIAATLTH
jgi:hypothetical protein